MKFVDSSEIEVHAGKGGDGIVSFRSARGKPKLGPDGGDGGTGGDVQIIADPRINTLSHLRFREVFRAQAGARGGSNGKTGRCGRPLVIRLPLGTVVIDQETGVSCGDLLVPEERIVVAKGGRRGLGNIHFKSASVQVPLRATEGQPGESKKLQLELKLIADVGLAGFPNAGKSTLLSRISAARPKIADYPFTTLTPQLGVVGYPPAYGDYWGKEVVVADIPGLIDGAADGRGLGHRFLRHLERTSVILFVIDAMSQEPFTDLVHLEKELASFSNELVSKRRLVFLSKTDTFFEKTELSAIARRFEEQGYATVAGSAISGDGIDRLVAALYNLVDTPDTSPLPFHANRKTPSNSAATLGLL